MKCLIMHLRIFQSGMVWLACGYAAVILGISLALEKLHIVEEIHFLHIQGIYELGFALYAIFLFSQLFAEEIEEGMFKWLFSLPLNPWRYLMERWLVGMIGLVLIFVGSMICIDLFAVQVEWTKAVFYSIVPALMLGHLAMFVSILTKNEWIGMAVPLFYWTFEAFSRGDLTKGLYLFLNTFPIEDISLEWNRGILLILACLLLLACGWILNKRMYFLK